MPMIIDYLIVLSLMLFTAVSVALSLFIKVDLIFINVGLALLLGWYISKRGITQIRTNLLVTSLLVFVFAQFGTQLIQKLVGVLT